MKKTLALLLAIMLLLSLCACGKGGEASKPIYERISQNLPSWGNKNFHAMEYDGSYTFNESDYNCSGYFDKEAFDEFVSSLPEAGIIVLCNGDDCFSVIVCKPDGTLVKTYNCYSDWNDIAQSKAFSYFASLAYYAIEYSMEREDGVPVLGTTNEYYLTSETAATSVNHWYHYNLKG